MIDWNYKDGNVGYCAVRYRHLGRITRWPIREEWKQSGEFTLGKVKEWAARAIEDGSMIDFEMSELVQTALILNVVDAALDNSDTIPCRSYALMLHIESPYFLIEAERGKATRLKFIDAKSWVEADRMIEEMEAELGYSLSSYVRKEGSEVFMMRSFDPSDPESSLGPIPSNLASSDDQILAAVTGWRPRGSKN